MQGVQFRYQSDEAMARINTFRAELKKKHREYVEEQEELELKEEAEAEEYRKRAEAEAKRRGREEDDDIPFRGMDENEIFDTSIGDLKCHQSTIKNYRDGQVRPVTTYTFYEDNSIVFVVECWDGCVGAVYDYRGSTKKRKRRTKPYYPEVDEYDDPLEFYHYYRDDFMDYDDAEEYYYENGGE